MLREIQGRTNDFLIASVGTSVPCGAFTYLVRDIPGVESFKVVQESVALTRISLVTGVGFESASIQALSRGFQGRLGDDVQIEVELVDSIPIEKSGKFRYISSKISLNAMPKDANADA